MAVELPNLQEWEAAADFFQIAPNGCIETVPGTASPPASFSPAENMGPTGPLNQVPL